MGRPPTGAGDGGAAGVSLLTGDPRGSVMFVSANTIIRVRRATIVRVTDNGVAFAFRLASGDVVELPYMIPSGPAHDAQVAEMWRSIVGEDADVVWTRDSSARAWLRVPDRAP